jgi:hypothetical protein
LQQLWNEDVYNERSKWSNDDPTLRRIIILFRLTSAIVRKLEAAGSGVLSGIMWDGYSYDYSLDEGKPVLLSNVTRGGSVAVCGGGECSGGWCRDCGFGE